MVFLFKNQFFKSYEMKLDDFRKLNTDIWVLIIRNK